MGLRSRTEYKWVKWLQRWERSSHTTKSHSTEYTAYKHTNTQRKKRNSNNVQRTNKFIWAYIIQWMKTKHDYCTSYVCLFMFISCIINEKKSNWIDDKKIKLNRTLNVENILLFELSGKHFIANSFDDLFDQSIEKCHSIFVVTNTHFKYFYGKKDEMFQDINIHSLVYFSFCIIFAVAPTQINVERCFSALAFILNKYRCKLTNENLNNILFIHLNSKIYKNIIDVENSHFNYVLKDNKDFYFMI